MMNPLMWSHTHQFRINYNARVSTRYTKMRNKLEYNVIKKHIILLWYLLIYIQIHSTLSMHMVCVHIHTYTCTYVYCVNIQKMVEWLTITQ